MKRFLFLCIFLITSLVTLAQDTLVHTYVGLKFGINNIRNKDLFQGPFTYSGTKFIGDVLYRHVTPSSEYSIDFLYSAGGLNKKDLPSATNSMSHLNLDYYFKGKSGIVKRRFKTFPGIGLHALANTINYLPEVPESEFKLTAAVFFTANLKSKYKVSRKGELSLVTSIPLAGFIYRPDFEINGKTQTGLTSPGRALWNVSLEYSHFVSSRLSVIATYRYNYFHYSQPRSVSILQNGLSLGLQFRF